VNETKERKQCFQRLTRILDYAEKKIFDHKKKDEGMRVRWCNVVIKAVDSYGRLLQTDEQELRIQKLEEQMKDAVIIPNEKH